MTDETRIRMERYLAGDMAPEEAAAFLASLRADPEAVTLLGRLVMQQALLFDVQRTHGARAGAESAVPPREGRASPTTARTTRSMRRQTAHALRKAVPRAARPAVPWGVWAAAACLAVAVLGFLLMPSQSGPTPGRVVAARESSQPAAGPTVARESPPRATGAAAQAKQETRPEDASKGRAVVAPEAPRPEGREAAAPERLAEGKHPGPETPEGATEAPAAPQETPAPLAPAPPAPALAKDSAQPPSEKDTSPKAALPVRLARLERVQDQAWIDADAGPRPAREKDDLFTGQGVRTIGADSLAVFTYDDATRLELKGDGAIARLTDREAPKGAAPARGRRVELTRGTLTADIARQPAGRPMVFTTPHAEATVLGTRLTLIVTADATRLEVTQGRVRFTKKDEGSVEVAAGRCATASAGTTLVSKPLPAAPRPLLVEDFTDSAAVDARWTFLKSFPAVVTGGRLDIDLSPRAGDGPEGWPPPGGLRSRQSFTFPLRVSAEVELTHRHENLNMALAWTTATRRAADLETDLIARLRGEEYALLLGTERLQLRERSGPWPRRERWTLEVDRTEMRFLVDGEEILRRPHGRTLSEPCVLELRGLSKQGAPSGAHARLDAVRVEPLER